MVDNEALLEPWEPASLGEVAAVFSAARSVSTTAMAGAHHKWQR
ncbi:MAG TPA: hypothetical protein VMA73_24880 [Streptosporangiaceae bacterium]|nr:hypothetical protein [Streptosporangiaceae bacterium]